MANHRRYLERKELYQKFGYDPDRELAYVLEQAGPLTGRILEAGTGKGHFALALAGAGHCFDTFDNSEDQLGFARQNLAYHGLDGQVILHLEDGAKLSFKDGSFDAVISVNMIHHLADPDRVLDEFIRVLAPAGKIVLSDFTAEGLAVMARIHASEGRAHEAGVTTLGQVEAYLKSRGFQTRQHASKIQEVLVARRETL